MNSSVALALALAIATPATKVERLGPFALGPAEEPRVRIEATYREIEDPAPYAFARALDTLAPEHRGGMIEQVLRNLRDRCMNLPPRGASDAREWLDRLLAGYDGPKRDAP